MAPRTTDALREPDVAVRAKLHECLVDLRLVLGARSEAQRVHAGFARAGDDLRVDRSQHAIHLVEHDVAGEHDANDLTVRDRLVGAE